MTKINKINNGSQSRFELPTTFQKEVAIKLRVNISNCSKEMAGAKLRDYLSLAILDYPVDEPTDSQIDLAESLGIDISNETRRTAKIKIKEHLLTINRIALNQLGIKEGDSITFYDNDEIVETRIVSTIKQNGRIFYKGTDFRSDYASILIEKIIKINAT